MHLFVQYLHRLNYGREVICVILTKIYKQFGCRYGLYKLVIKNTNICSLLGNFFKSFKS